MSQIRQFQTFLEALKCWCILWRLGGSHIQKHVMWTCSLSDETSEEMQNQQPGSLMGWERAGFLDFDDTTNNSLLTWQMSEISGWIKLNNSSANAQTSKTLPRSFDLSQQPIFQKSFYINHRPDRSEEIWPQYGLFINAYGSGHRHWNHQ